MCKKYSKIHKKLDIIIPKILLEYQFDKLIKDIIKTGYYDHCVIIKGQKESPLKGSVLTFRVLGELSYHKYTGLFKNCLPNVLVTGDQSITDIISCCKNYNIYYQIMDWQMGFAKNLADALNKDFLKKVSSSCGLEEFSVKSKMNLQKVADMYNFEKLGKKKLDNVLKFALELRKNTSLQNYTEIVNSSRTKSSVLVKLKKSLE